jgi:DNA-binding XRE family transcriptional regulator
MPTRTTKSQLSELPNHDRGRAGDLSPRQGGAAPGRGYSQPDGAMSGRRAVAGVVRTAFGRALMEFRKERGLSQEHLAELADLDRTTPSLLERGLRQPTLAVVFLLGRALEVDPRELVGRVMEAPRLAKALWLSGKEGSGKLQD